MEMIDDIFERIQYAHPYLFWYLLRFAVCVFVTLAAVVAIGVVIVVIAFFYAVFTGSATWAIWLALTPFALFIAWALIGTIVYMGYYL